MTLVQKIIAELKAGAMSKGDVQQSLRPYVT